MDKISPASSTRDVESFNNTIIMPQVASTQNRVNCVVAEKKYRCNIYNTGNKSMGISPGKFYLEFENKQSFKKRKLEKMKKKLNKTPKRN